MAETAASSRCGYCGYPVPVRARTCARCGIRLIDITRHHPGYEAKELLLDSLDTARDKARDTLARLGPRKVAGAALGSMALGAAIVGYRLLRKREV